jgi:hypothetical protein
MKFLKGLLVLVVVVVTVVAIIAGFSIRYEAVQQSKLMVIDSVPTPIATSTTPIATEVVPSSTPVPTFVPTQTPVPTEVPEGAYTVSLECFIDGSSMGKMTGRPVVLTLDDVETDELNHEGCNRTITNVGSVELLLTDFLKSPAHEIVLYPGQEQIFENKALLFIEIEQ